MPMLKIDIPAAVAKDLRALGKRHKLNQADMARALLGLEVRRVIPNPSITLQDIPKGKETHTVVIRGSIEEVRSVRKRALDTVEGTTRALLVEAVRARVAGKI